MRQLRLSAFAIGVILLLLMTGALSSGYFGRTNSSTAQQPSARPSVALATSALPTRTAKASPKPIPAATPAIQSVAATPAPTPPPLPTTSTAVFGHNYYGIGPEADQALRDPLTQQANVKILSSWFNGTKDLAWITGWQGASVNGWWNRGYVLHVVVYDNAANDPSCNCRRWPISAQYLQDMQRLAQVFAGPNDGRHIVIFSLDTEFQTYIQPNNQYNSATKWYYDQLQANMLQARTRIRTSAPNALVSLSWGGWQTRWNDPANGGGLSMIPYFASTMRQMDFISFQAMQSDTNVNDILTNVRVFGAYNRHLMVSHYLPDNQSQTTYNNDIGTFFTQSFVNQTRSGGLFAFSFMSATDMNAGWPLSTCVAGVNRYTQ